MGGLSFELPLFPLNVVLFPGMVLPLHIFESRYRLMIRRCLEQKSPFGVVLIQSDSASGDEHPCLVGTLARIMTAERLDDGRFNLLTEGEKRFRILEERRDQQPYLMALVQEFVDKPTAPEALEGLQRKAADLFRRYIRVMLAVAGREQLRLDLPSEAEGLSYLIGYCLDLSDVEKQQLLELTSTTERLELEIAILKREEQLLRRMLSSSQIRPLSDDPHASLN
ncbi:MAG TPA: LON peptidase substrate-binding domain-containing protein [Ktedonosporobacter sp.]|nr:LON peptidase substrate-binding domain-containing protein [Ktedonosporobacter sp.]